MSQTVLVLGATGIAGREVVKLLTAENITVKAATRFPEKYAVKGATPVLLVQEDASTFAPALAGVDKVFLSALPLDVDAPAKLVPFIAEAQKAGVKKMVFLSAIGAEHDEAFPLRKIERAVQQSGIAYNIIRPNFFMENFSEGPFSGTIKALGQILVPAEDAKVSMISTEDIAAVAVKLLLDDSLQGQELTLTGPSAITHHEAAQTISAQAGKAVNYVPISEADLINAVTGQGAPESAAQYLAGLFRNIRAGNGALVNGHVAGLTGRPARSFEQFVKASLQHF